MVGEPFSSAGETDSLARETPDNDIWEVSAYFKDTPPTNTSHVLEDWSVGIAVLEDLDCCMIILTKPDDLVSR